MSCANPRILNRATVEIICCSILAEMKQAYEQCFFSGGTHWYIVPPPSPPPEILNCMGSCGMSNAQLGPGCCPLGLSGAYESHSLRSTRVGDVAYDVLPLLCIVLCCWLSASWWRSDGWGRAEQGRCTGTFFPREKRHCL